jgi:hypothetical protein
MHDFIQHQSFNSQTPFRLTRAVSESLHAVMRSFNETPAYRAAPRLPARRKSAVRPNRKS